MITHVVLMKFKPEVTPETISEVEAMLGRLPGIISEIRHYSFGRDVVRSERSYDFALVSGFDSLDTMQVYQQHPDHQQLLQKLVQICKDIVAVDYESTP